MAKRKSLTNEMFWDSAKRNRLSYSSYLNRLCELAMSVFKWENLPPTVDARYLEMALLYNGYALFFYDEVLGYLALQTMIGGRLDVYRVPIERTAYSANGYQNHKTNADSVLIFDNYMHNSKAIDLARYAGDLYELDQIIMINAKAQKTPVLITCDEDQRLTLKNLYSKYDGNQPFIFGTSGLQTQPLSSISTGAAFIAPQLYDLRTKIWNEALTYIGIANVSEQKKAHLLQDEVYRMNGGTIASRLSRLESRRQACEQINRMFGLSVSVDYRDVEEDNSFDVPEDPAAVSNALRARGETEHE